MSDAPPEPLARRLGRLALVALGLLLLAEAGVRAFITSPSRQQPDAALGFTYQPDSLILQGREGFAANRLDAQGFNDDIDPVAARRVLLLGDSFAEALQVPREQNFVELAEARLPGTEIINAARSGMGPGHFPVARQRFGAGTALTVLALNPTDLQDLHAHAAGTMQGRDRLRDLAMPVISRSALATFLSQRAMLLMRRAAETAPMASADAPPTAPETRPEAAPRAAAHDASVPAADPADLAAVTGLLDALSAQGPVALLWIPVLDYSRKPAPEAAYSAKVRVVFAEAAARLGLPFADAGPALAAAFAATGQPPTGFANSTPGEGHLNAAGHRAVATVLARLVAEAAP